MGRKVKSCTERGVAKRGGVAEGSLLERMAVFSTEEARDAIRNGMHAVSTCSARRSALTAYEGFCELKELVPWPTSARKLEAFGGAMKLCGHPTTGKCYISHVRTHSALNFQGMPAADQDYLKFVNQSLKRGAGEEDCWPIGTEMIGKLALAAVTREDHEVVSASVVMFFFLMRVSEFVEADMMVDDVQKVVSVRVCRRKNDQQAIGRTVAMKAIEEPERFGRHAICPYVAASIWVNTKAKTNPDRFRRGLYRLLGQAGFGNSQDGRKRQLYSPHSLRKGGAQSYVLAGTQRDLVQKIGGWSSEESLKRYEDEVMLNPCVQPIRPPLKSLSTKDADSRPQ
ncbi:hypothetical protein DIPPA_31410 [Diplonema papillatum]|nr:hypothetical protein DIPPA_31410 [Diplonema papillatum]